MASSSLWKMSSPDGQRGWSWGGMRVWEQVGVPGKQAGVTAAFPVQAAGSTTATTAAGPSRR